MNFLADAAAQAKTLSTVEHRPWPLNPRPWVLGQSWQRLLFAHWRVTVEELRPHVPDLLEIEEYDGTAWLALTPFRVRGLRLRGLPPAPLLSNFLELNCRTYVRYDDRPGIWFFSLDASSRLAVEGARRLYRLPYRHSEITFDGKRFMVGRTGTSKSFRAAYEGQGAAHTAEPGSLEHFLVERYCLYAGGGELRADIHHPPWQIKPATAEVEQDGISPVRLEGRPIYHFAERQDVVVWQPEPIV